MKTTAEIVIAIIGIVCQVVIAILALFGRMVRHWMYKPRINLTTGNGSPYVSIEKANENKLSDIDSSDIVYLRFKVENNGNESARDTMIVVSEYYKKKGAADAYSKKEDITKHFLFTSKDSKRQNYSQSVIPNLPYFVDFGTIQKYDAAEPITGSANAKQCYKVVLKFQEGQMLLPNGEYVLPVCIYSRDLQKAIVCPIKIYWNSDNIPNDLNNKDCSVFQFKVLTNSEFVKIKDNCQKEG